MREFETHYILAIISIPFVNSKDYHEKKQFLVIISAYT
jgi:hypothetical protein